MVWYCCINLSVFLYFQMVLSSSLSCGNFIYVKIHFWLLFYHVWSPFSLKNKSSLEAVHNIFLSFLCYRCNISHSSYAPILDILFLDSVELRWIKFDLYFLYSVAHSNIDCPKLLYRLSFMVPQRFSRSHVTFYISSQRTNYAINFPYYATSQ